MGYWVNLGYVYQACSFLYGGKVLGEIYLKDGIKIHVRQMKHFLSPKDKRLTVRPTLQQMNELNIEHIKGMQFKYLAIIRDKKKILRKAKVELNQKYPKEKDLLWKKKDKDGKWIKCSMPKYITDIKIK